MGSLRSNASFVRLLTGRALTNAGDSLYAIAAMWLVFDLTGSSFYTGIAGFLVLGTQPLQFLAGPLVDRWSLRHVLVGTQTIQLVGTLTVPLAAVTGYLSVWLILLLMPFLEFLNQCVYPAQNAALPRIVDEENLVQANSLFSFSSQGVDLVFGAVAGVLIAALGAVTLYIVDAVTFALALVLFAGVTVPTESSDLEAGNEEPDGPTTGYITELREGIAYLRGSVLVKLLVGAVVANFAYGLLIAVLPAFADSLGGPEMYGVLTATMAAGTLTGAAGASFVKSLPFGQVAITGYALSAACWFGVLFAPGILLTVTLFFAAWVPVGAVGVMDQSMVQSAVADDLLGRVSSVMSSLGTVMMPVGSLLGGVLADTVGPSAVLSGMGIASGFLAVYYLASPRVRSLPSVVRADEAVLGLKATADGGR